MGCLRSIGWVCHKSQKGSLPNRPCAVCNGWKADTSSVSGVTLSHAHFEQERPSLRFANIWRASANASNGWEADIAISRPFEWKERTHRRAPRFRILVRQSRATVWITVLTRERARTKFVGVARIEDSVLGHEITVRLCDSARVDTWNAIRRVVQTGE